MQIPYYLQDLKLKASYLAVKCEIIFTNKRVHQAIATILDIMPDIYPLS